MPDAPADDPLDDPSDDAPPARRVFVSGASGFVGTAVVAALLRRGYAVNALVHTGDVDLPGDLKSAASDVKTVRGSMFDKAVLDLALRGCDAAIHLVGIIEEDRKAGVTFESVHVGGTRAVVDAAIRLGVGRYVQMSALGARPNAVSRYHKTKWEAEEYVRANAPAWTIFRPSLIHGPGGDFMRQEAAWARGKAAPFVFMPYFGAGPLGFGGAGKLQPVFIDDVAAAFADAVGLPASVGRVYNLAGPEVMTWPEMHRTASGIIRGKSKVPAALPAWLAKAVASVAPASLLPFNRDQVLMSQEDNTGDTTEWRADFGVSPAAFAEALRGYADQL